MKCFHKYADLFIRVPVGFHLIYGTQDNILSWNRMLEFRDFLENLSVPFALAAAHVSVYAQFFAGVSFILGYKTKWTAYMMMINFTIAILLVHTSDSYPSIFPAIMMLCASVFILLNGNGYCSMETFFLKAKKTG